MSIIIRTVVAIPLLVFFSLTSWLGWTLLDPLAGEIEAAASTGFGFDPLFLLIGIAFRFVFPAFAVVTIAWWIFGTIRSDARFSRGRARR
jgi:hypothetical protein